MAEGEEISTARKLALLRRQLERAPAARESEEAADLWAESCVTVIGAALGKWHSLKRQASNVSFEPLVRYSPVAEVRARMDGVTSMTKVLHLAVLEVEIRATDAEPLPSRWIAPQLWAEVGHLVELARWEQVVLQAVIFFEDWIRNRAGFPNKKIGADLMSDAFGPAGRLALGKGEAASEGQGWALLARGLSMAVRNPAGHRIDQRADAERFALGVLGVITLLMTQVELEYP
jgi:hypothetical protein